MTRIFNKIRGTGSPPEGPRRAFRAGAQGPAEVPLRSTDDLGPLRWHRADPGLPRALPTGRNQA